MFGDTEYIRIHMHAELISPCEFIYLFILKTPHIQGLPVAKLV